MSFWDIVTEIFSKDRGEEVSKSKIALPDFPKGNEVCNQIAYLHPKVRKAVESVIKQCKGQGFTIIETYRTPKKQQMLYEQGRSSEGDIVTKAQAYESYHNYGLALDISDVNLEIVAMFEGAGFEWGGRWKSFKDTPHFQMTFGLTISDLKKLYNDGGMVKVWEHVGYKL